MENKSHALAAGAFVLLVSALLILLAFWLSRDRVALGVYELSSSEAVTGLQPQASVRYKGVNVGRVTDIALDSQKPGNVLVRIAVSDSAPITRSTFATLGFQGVTGLAFVQLDDAGAPGAPLAPNAQPPERIALRRGLIAQLSDQGAHLLGQLDQASVRINQLLAPENQAALMAAVNAMGRAALRVENVGNQAQATFASMRETSERLGRSADSVNTSAAAFKSLSTRMNQAGGTLDQLGQAADAFSLGAQSLNANLGRSLGDAARSARQIGRVADVIEENPQSILWGKSPLAPGPGETGFVAPAASRAPPNN